MLRRMIFMALAAIALINTCELKAAVSIWDTVWTVSEPANKGWNWRGAYTFNKTKDKFYAYQRYFYHVRTGNDSSYYCLFSNETGLPIDTLYGQGTRIYWAGQVMQDTNYILYRGTKVDLRTGEGVEVKCPLIQVYHYDPESNNIWGIGNNTLYRLNFDTFQVLDTFKYADGIEITVMGSLVYSPNNKYLALQTFLADFTAKDFFIDMFDFSNYRPVKNDTGGTISIGWYNFSDDAKKAALKIGNSPLKIYDIENDIFTATIDERGDVTRNNFDSSAKYYYVFKDSLVQFFDTETGELSLLSYDVYPFKLSEYSQRQYKTNSFFPGKNQGDMKYYYNLRLNITPAKVEQLNSSPATTTNLLNNTLSINSEEIIKRIIIYDYKGAVIQKFENVNNTSFSSSLNFAAGVYFAGIEFENKIIVKKILITN